MQSNKCYPEFLVVLVMEELFNTYLFRQIPKNRQTLKNSWERREDLDSLAVTVPHIAAADE
jgi:hypothetical protein